MKDNNFKKAGCCFLKTFLFLFLGFRSVVHNVYSKLSKRAVIVISAILLLILSISWLVCYVHIKTKWLRYVHTQVLGRVEDYKRYDGEVYTYYETKYGKLLDEYIDYGYSKENG